MAQILNSRTPLRLGIAFVEFYLWLGMYTYALMDEECRLC